MVLITLKMENIGKWKFIKSCKMNLMKKKTETIIFNYTYKTRIFKLNDDFEINYLSLSAVFITLTENGSETTTGNFIVRELLNSFNIGRKDRKLKMVK